MWRGKNICVAGGSGMVGRYLVDILQSKGARVQVASLDDQSLCPEGVKFLKVDLRDPRNCELVCDGMDYVFNLLGVKGSPLMTQLKPASFLVPQILCSFNMLEAARRCGVKKYLYTSSIGVYAPSQILKEDDVWGTFPPDYGKCAAWAKRIGELQVEAYINEYKWVSLFTVRPGNVYGRYDNFDIKNSLVIPSIIVKAINDNPLNIWGDGTAIRDFIHAYDVALAMICVVENDYNKVVNIGSGQPTSILDLAKMIVGILEKKGISVAPIEWDKTKPIGDKVRLMDISRLTSLGFKQTISLQDGLEDTISWFLESRSKKHYNVLDE